MPGTSARGLSEFLWQTRYRDGDASPPEGDIAATWDRVAASAAAPEREPERWREAFRGLLAGYRFLPGGRILAGAGTRRRVTLCNCFVMGLIDDSIEGIFESLKEGALTMQEGGGVGYDFSTLRPCGIRAQASGMLASGPVSFLRVWDATCATVWSTGARRGAMMATLRCDHPDIEAFIDAKRTPGLERFNLSVLLTDDFLRAVDADAEWPLVFPLKDAAAAGQRTVHRPWSGHAAPVACAVLRTVRARALWERLCASAEVSAEPGVLFIDRINADNNLGYCETLSATNPCAEAPLPPFGACTLGSLNLAAFVRAPFTRGASLDLEGIAGTARTAVRFLDNIIEITRYPLLRQREQAQRSRRLGLGITGLADALAMLCLAYDDEAARTMAATVLRVMRDSAYRAAVELARERGPCPAFERGPYLERPFIRALPAELRDAIGRHGVRNSHLLAIAPAGTISLLAGNVSSGIEPIFALEAWRRVLGPDGAPRHFHVTDFAWDAWRAAQPPAPARPAFFRVVADVSPRDQLEMQAALQPYVDGSISKTVTLAAGADAGTVAATFQAAYALGLKGCTVFRDAARPGVLTGPYRDEGAAPGVGVPCCDTLRESD